MANKFLDNNGVLYLWQKIKSIFVQKEEGKGLSSNDYTDAEKTKLSGIATGANKYVHPTYTEKTSGMYKITVDKTGHVSAATAVAKSDITGLGIPAQDTTYSDATTDTSGLLSAKDKAKLDGIAEGANKYVHPTTAGNKHIPTGGSTGQILGYSASGTAKWIDPPVTISVDDALSETSTNPAENQAITKELAKKADKSAIPTVGNGVLSVQRNGKSVGTFSANAAENVSINIPVPEKVSELENDAGYGTYTKPSTGIPKSDLASSVQASLGKADTALQKHQDISGKLDKTGDASNTTVAFSVASSRENVKTGEKLSVIVGKIAKWFAELKTVAFTGSYNDLANKPTIPDGSKYLPLAGGTMSGDIDMATNKKDILIGTQPASAYGTFTPVSSGQITTDKQFVDLLPTMRSYIGTYNYKTSSADSWYDVISVRHRNGYGDGSSWGVMIFAPLFGGDLQWNLNTNKDVWQGYRTILDSANYTSYAAKSNHTHAVITNSAIVISGANNAAKWCRLGTLVSAGNFSTAVISVWSGDGANGNASQNSWFEIHIKDGWQSSQSATKACGVTVYRTRCGTVKVKVIPTAHNTYTVWVYLPWAYWNGNYAVYGRYTSWTQQLTNQDAEPSGTAADTSYYDYAFTSSTVANATTWNGLTQDCDTYNSADTWLLVKNGNKIQHRLSYELKVKEATTLTDSGWVSLPAVSGVTPTTNYNGVKYRKQGKIVAVQGAVVFASDQSGPTIGQLPTGYRPTNGSIIRPGLDGSTYNTYYVSIGTDGKILFSTKTQGFFKKNSAYTVDVVFFVD